MDDDKLKLFFVYKIGYNSKGEGLYEFMFTDDEMSIDVERWCWDLSPACDNATPPEETYISKIINLKTKTFNLKCLHEADDRPYMHGYHTIHALAYETDTEEDSGSGNGIIDYEAMFENEDVNDLPLLVFHYGMTLKKIKEIFEERKIIYKDGEFIETSLIQF